MILKYTNQPYHHKKKRFFVKTLAVILSFLLLMPILSASMIIGYCNNSNISAESEIRPGASVTVRLYFDTAEIGYEGYFSYDSSVLSLTRIIPVNSDLYVDFQVSTESGFVHVTHNTPVRQMVQLTFLVSSDAAIGSKTFVRFYSGKVLGGEVSETLDDVSFEFTVADRKSSDASLHSLSVSVYRSESDRDRDENAFLTALAPAFSANVRTYSTTVANEYAFFRVIASPNDSNAVVTSISDGELTEGAVNSVLVNVEAEDGTKNSYTIQIFRESPSDTSMDVSYPVSEVTSEEPSEESSEITSEETSEEESFEESSEETASEESPTASESLYETTSEEDAVPPNVASASVFTSTSEPQERGNWTGIILCIAAVGALSLLVLTLRVFILFRKKHR